MKLKVTQAGLLVLKSAPIPKPVGASTRIILSASVDPAIQAAGSFTIRASAYSTVEQHYFYAHAETQFRMTGRSEVDEAHTDYEIASPRIVITPQAGAMRIAVTPVATTVYLYPNATAGRDIYVFAETSMGFSSGTGPDEGLLATDSASMVFIHPQAEVESVGKFGASSGLLIQPRADAELETSEEILIPGGDLSNGLLVVLASNVSGEFPVSYTETSSGVVIMANGIDPMLRWDGLTTEASEAGVVPPAPVTVGRSGSGLIVGTRWAYYRYVDVFGNHSNLSPASAKMVLGESRWIDSITAGESGVPVCSSEDHGLSSGDRVFIFGVDEMPITGGFTITVTSPDSFTLGGITCSPGTTSKPSYWVAGSASVSYSGCEVPTDPLVARRQILRNLDANAEVFYVDVDTDDLSSDTFFSSRLDDELSTCEAVPLRFQDEMPAANRHGVPPSHKGVLAYHLGRVFAAVDRPYSIGHAEVSLGKSIVRGVGTHWTASMAGRAFYVEGSTRLHYVDSVLGDTFLALDRPFAGVTSKFARYSIRPTDQERRLIYYSEPNLPESWPAWNGFAVPDHGDEMTGLMTMRSYLYIIERRHISSFTFKSDPGRDGFIFLKSHRGCINSRCSVLVEDTAYMLDEAGVHRFDGEASTHISARISNVFNDPHYPYRLDWKSPNILLWHAVQDPTTESIRWFVDFVGKPRLTHALCYDYRRDRWWLEQYPEAIASSCISTIGYRRVLAGTTARRVLALGEGTLDGIVGNVYGAMSGTIASATDTTFTVEPSQPELPVNLAGMPITITSGPAKGLTGIAVATLTGRTTEIWQPWPVKPGPGDTFQIGGVTWDWRNGWLPFLDQETDNARDIGVVFKPTSSGSSFSVRLYYDYADTPRAWGVDRSVDGLTTQSGSPDIQVNTDKVRGYAIQRMQSRREAYSLSDYFVSVNLVGVQGVEPARIFEVTVDGVFSQARQ